MPIGFGIGKRENPKNAKKNALARNTKSANEIARNANLRGNAVVVEVGGMMRVTMIDPTHNLLEKQGRPSSLVMYALHASIMSFELLSSPCASIFVCFGSRSMVVC